jgi:ABC-2 type transport system ATP-binding protein
MQKVTGDAEVTMMECAGLSKDFGTLAAVREVSLSLCRGQVLGLVGPNGAGKTTLLRMLATLLHPTRGDVWICGQSPGSDLMTVRRRIGYLPDFFNLHRDLKLRECLTFYAHAYSVPPADILNRVREALVATGLLEKENDFVRHLSRGMVQRLGMAMLMTRDAEIMILDEPASGLDPTARVQLRALLRRLSSQGKAILISSHILSDLEESCTHVAIMDRGRLVMRGTVDEIRQGVFAGLRYRIRVLDDPASALSAAVSAGALKAAVEDGALLVNASGDDHISRINACLVAGGFRVAELRLVSKLEDAFMKLTTGEEVSHDAR